MTYPRTATLPTDDTVRVVVAVGMQHRQRILDLIAAAGAVVLDECGDDDQPVTDARPTSRIAIASNGVVIPVRLDDVRYFAAAGVNVDIQVADRRHTVRAALNAIEARLDRERFMRVHRSTIVNIDHVRCLRRGSGAEGELLLTGGERISVSRMRRDAVEHWLGLLL